MPKGFLRRRTPLLVGMLMLVACLLVEALMPAAWRVTLREMAFDAVLAIDAQVRPPQSPARPPLTIVDIDRRSIEAIGPWPWSRDTMARLIERIAAAKPAVIA